MTSSQNTTLRIAKNLRFGDKVMAVAFNGGLSEKIFWELDGDTAYVSSPSCYQRMLQGDIEARPIGYLLTDLVFNDE